MLAGSQGEPGMTQKKRTQQARRVPAPAVAPMDWSLIPVADGSDDSLVLQFVQRVRREPALLFTTAYLLLSMLGLWCSYWFYRGFRLPVLDYLQASDFLVAGVRDPVYALVLLVGVAIVLLVSWPETLRLRNPARVRALCARHRGWRLLFTPSALTSWQSTGLRPLTAMVAAVGLTMVAGSALYVSSRAQAIRQDDAGNPVLVQFSGQPSTALRPARLLGTSSAFVFLWWPDQQRAEAVPIATIARLQAPSLRHEAAVAPAGPAGAVQAAPGKAASVPAARHPGAALPVPAQGVPADGPVKDEVGQPQP